MLYNQNKSCVKSCQKTKTHCFPKKRIVFQYVHFFIPLFWNEKLSLVNINPYKCMPNTHKLTLSCIRLHWLHEILRFVVWNYMYIVHSVSLCRRGFQHSASGRPESVLRACRDLLQRHMGYRLWRPFHGFWRRSRLPHAQLHSVSSYF